MNDDSLINDPAVFYDVNRNVTPPVCSACDCEPKTHILLWSCPIFQGEKICVECCHEDMLKPGIEIEISAKLGETITAEQLKAKCRDCGRNSLATAKGDSNDKSAS